MTFEVDGLKIFGTAGSAQDSYVRIAADEQEFWAGGEEVLTLSADGIDTKAVYADGNISAGVGSIDVCYVFNDGSFGCVESASEEPGPDEPVPGGGGGGAA